MDSRGDSEVAQVADHDHRGRLAEQGHCEGQQAIWVTALLIAGDRVETLAVFASIGGIIIFIPVMGAALRLKSVAPEIYNRSQLKLKGGLYFAAPIIGLLLSVVIVILLIDLSSHQHGMIFLAVFVIWTIAGAIYAWLRLRGRNTDGPS